MRNKIIFVVVIFITLSLIYGCAAFKRKFIPPPKEKHKSPQMTYVPTHEYKKTISNQLVYKKYYTYWKTMEMQLIDDLGKNQKRDLMSYQEAMHNLLAIKKYLVEEKANQLDIYIKQLEDIFKKYQTAYESSSITSRTKSFLITHKRNVEHNFRYGKVKNYIIQQE